MIIKKNHELVQYAGAPINSSLSYNTYGFFKTQLSAGSASLFVRVVDDMGAVSISYISTPVTVTNDDLAIKSIVDSLNSNNCGSQFVSSLLSGDIQLVSQLVNSLAASLNALADSGVNSSNTTNTVDERVSARSTLTSAVCSMPLSDISSVKLVSSSLSTLTNAITENSLDSAVN